MFNRKGTNNEVLRRKRIVLLLLPVILVPLLTLGFYALGGGKAGADARGMVLTKGLNMSLPEAKFDAKKKGLNKLGFYKEWDQDSIKLRESRKMDPYYGWRDSAMTARRSSGSVNRGAATGLTGETSPADLQAGELMRKLELLKGMLNRQQQGVLSGEPPAGHAVEPPFGAPRSETGALPSHGTEVSRAGSLPPGVAETPGSVPLSPAVAGTPGGGQGDADLDKLNTIMDKVLRVRYPGDGPLHDSVPAGQEGLAAQPLTTPPAEETMTTLGVTEKDDLETGFIDLDDDSRGDSLAENMIAAVVDGAQTLISGEAVALRTAGEAMLGGVRVPYGTGLSGKATLSGERLLISVNAVRIGSRVVPVALDVIDMDGMPGIRVKGSINRDVSKESADEAVGSLGLTSVDPSVAGQATAAGLQAAKNLLSRKIRLVRVGLPAGYRVLLRNTKVNH